MILTELKSYIRDRIDTNSTDFPDVKLIRMLNVAQDKVVNAIQIKDRLFQYDDDNYTDLPEGYIDLTEDVNKYNIKEDENFANILYVAKVFCMGKNGEYYELSKGEIELETLDSVPVTGEPERYRISGKTIVLTPAPDYTNTTETVPQQAKLKVYFARTPKKILVTDTTLEVGVPTTFHHLLALLTDWQFASAKQMTVKNDIWTEIQDEERKFGLHLDKLNNNINVVLSAEDINYI